MLGLFSGGGGLDLGFKQAGFDLILSTDFNKDCCKTLEQNFNHKIICDDVDNLKLNKGITDIVVGGSPCQAFSNANRQNGSKLLDNPKNSLVLSYIHKIKKINPLVFVYENVPQVLTASDGLFIKEFKERLPDYHIEVKVLNAYDYGVAQLRKRAIFIGSRIGIIKHPEPQNTYLTINDAFNDLNDNIFNQLDRRNSKEETIHKISYIPQGGNWENLPEKYKINLSRSKTQSNLYSRLHNDKPSNTLVHFGKSIIIHPNENRIISIREGARIQGFPDDYIFVGTLNEKIQMVANAVSVPLAKAIAVHIKKEMDNYLNDQVVDANKRII